MEQKALCSAIESGDSRETWIRSRVGPARVVKLVDTRDLKQFEPFGGNSGGEPVKFGERPGRASARANAEPSPDRKVHGKV